MTTETLLTTTPIHTPFGLDGWDWEQMRIGLPVSHRPDSTLQPPPVDEFHEPCSFEEWTDDPFHPIQKPFGAFLEPAGYAAIQKMKKPNTRSYKRRMPRTLALARTIYQALPEVAIWGRQRPGGSAAWDTITAGKWVEKTDKRPGFSRRAMCEFDVLKMLADPAARGLASTDSSGDRFSRVRHVRIDIDLDDLFQYDGQDHLPELRGEIRLVHDVFAGFGLPAVYVFRTGNRGIQAVAGIPWLDRAAAWVLTEMIRTVLKDSRIREWRATDFKTALDGLMRLPLGLHKWSGSLALLLGKDGMILPAEEQADIFVNAFIERPDDFSTDWAEEMRPRLGAHHEIPLVTLQEIIAEFPRNPLVRTFLSACDQFDVRGGEKHNELVPHTNVGFTTEAESEDVSDDKSPVFNDELVPHTNEVFTTVSFGSCPAKLKQIGQAILNAGFRPGESFAYYVNGMKGIKGLNAIGWAIVCNDGDREKAKVWLDAQAEKIPGTEAAVADRKTLIAWCIPRNDTYDRFMAWRKLNSHRSLDVSVDESDAESADRIVAVLPDLRNQSACRTKVFTEKSLSVIKQTLELMRALSRESADGLIRISERTLAAQMTGGVDRKDVARNLLWITYDPAIARENQNCLIEALEIVERPKKATDPTVYKLGAGL